ncbi:Ig-like domain-containing protein [Methanobrevibacter sp. DSM 116169]|uniref:Ig-like domain-containing protein n=1 Tax=Methanobrevibacter sp. DSM 116169 TaxID=3242727 RepID=UPI0038FCA9AD
MSSVYGVVYNRESYSKEFFVRGVEKYVNSTSLTLVSSKDKVTVGNSVVLTATLRDKNADGLKGMNVKFYAGTVLVETLVTNNDGIATLTVNVDDVTNYSCEFEEDNDYIGSISNIVTVEVIKNTVITLTANKSVIEPNEQVTFTANLKEGNNPLSNKPIIFNGFGSNPISVNTDVNGNAILTRNISVTGDFYVNFIGDGDYNNSESNIVTVTIIDKKETSLSLWSDKTTVNTGETVSFTGVLEDEDGYIFNKTVKLINSDTGAVIDTIIIGDVTYLEGNIKFTKIIEESVNLKLVFDGDNEYNSSNSNIISITVNDPYLFVDDCTGNNPSDKYTIHNYSSNVLTATYDTFNDEPILKLQNRNGVSYLNIKDIPSTFNNNFKITWEQYDTSNSNSNNACALGYYMQDYKYFYIAGLNFSVGQINIGGYTNGSWFDLTSPSSTARQRWVKYELTVIDGVHTLKNITDDVTQTVTDTRYNAGFFAFRSYNLKYLKDIKIEDLGERTSGGGNSDI